MDTRLKFARCAIMLFAVPLLLWSMNKSAHAAPPSNDTLSNAKAVTVGFSEVIDTSEATIDADDAQLAESCIGPIINASVWYKFTTTFDVLVAVDFLGSNYSADAIVGVGEPGNLVAITCGLDNVLFSATPGTTYYILVFDNQRDGGGNGGTLNISFIEPLRPTVDVTIDPTGYFNPKSRAAIISGTYTCRDGGDILVIGGASQPANSKGPPKVIGSFAFTEVGKCDGLSHTWSAEVLPESGKFTGGKTDAVAIVNSCGRFVCGEEFVTQTVKLRGGGHKVGIAATGSVYLFLPAVQGNQP